MHLKRTVRQGYYRIVRHRFESLKDSGGEHTQLNKTRFACLSAPAHKREQIRLTSLSHGGDSFSGMFPSVEYCKSLWDPDGHRTWGMVEEKCGGGRHHSQPELGNFTGFWGTQM